MHTSYPTPGTYGDIVFYQKAKLSSITLDRESAEIFLNMMCVLEKMGWVIVAQVLIKSDKEATVLVWTKNIQARMS